MNQKTWVSEGDDKVRKTHAEIGGITIDIFEPFEVGGYLMMFPMDSSLGADRNEIDNCRCTVEYSKKEENSEEESQV